MTELPRYALNWGMVAKEDDGAFYKVSDVSSRLQQLEEAASERDAIASLVSDREEAGTYPKVEGLLTRIAQLEQEKATLQQQLAVEREKHDEEAYNLMAEAKETTAAALAETREALQRLVAGVERDDNPSDEGHCEHSDEMQNARAVLAREAQTGAPLAE